MAVLIQHLVLLVMAERILGLMANRNMLVVLFQALIRGEGMLLSLTCMVEVDRRAHYIADNGWCVDSLRDRLRKSLF